MLPLSGFDRSDGKAHGVKQVLDLAFGVSSGVFDEDTNRLFREIARSAGQDATTHYDIGRCAPIEVEWVPELHAEHIEAKAFAALMAFVISLNDGGLPGEPTLFTPTVLGEPDVEVDVSPRFLDAGGLKAGIGRAPARAQALVSTAAGGASAVPWRSRAAASAASRVAAVNGSSASIDAS